jgi:lycopene cyclase domain-containing protein
MDTHYTYLILNLACIFFPFILSFDKKIAYYKLWKPLFIGILISAAFFIIWDILFTKLGVWSFNPTYIIGIYIFNLPIEEILFFITVPYACIFIYEVVNGYTKRDVIGCGKPYSVVISVICLVLIILFHDKTYTLVNASICLIMLLYAAFIYKSQNLGRFFLAYFISLIPFLICNGLLTALPVVIYNNNENMNLRLFTIPLEDTLYGLSLMLIPILIMDYFKKPKSN